MNLDTMTNSHRTQFLIDLPPIPKIDPANLRSTLPKTISIFQDLRGMSAYSKYGSLILRSGALLSATEMMFNFSPDVQQKIFKILMLLLEQFDLHNTNIVQLFNDYFPKENPFSFCLTSIINFLKMEMNNHEQRYRSNRNIYPTLSDLSDTVRGRHWFQRVVNNFVNEDINQRLLENLLQFVMTEVTSRVLAYHNNEIVLAIRNASNEGLVRKKKICSTCAGYYYCSQ
ncbi:hypothetical protein FQR65_LT03610 [Abscondita terminalis]|nr:hypothetical protein FQR65_LT03610 [Abscondita terminalis]